MFWITVWNIFRVIIREYPTLLQHPFSGAQLYSGNISGIKIFNRGLDTDIRTQSI
jgi:hypothetical protein